MTPCDCHIFELPITQPISPREEGPMKTVLCDILQYILVFTDQSKNTGLVSHQWSIITVKADQDSKQHKLKQATQLIIEGLDPDQHAQCITDFTKLQQSRPVYIPGYIKDVANCVEVRENFLIAKGLVIGNLRKVSANERDHLQTLIVEELPDSMKDIFMLAYRDLKYVYNGDDLDTVMTLAHSYQPFSMDYIGYAVVQLTRSNARIELFESVLGNGQISEDHRGRALYQAAKHNRLKHLELLLADGPIPDNWRRDAHDNANSLKLAYRIDPCRSQMKLLFLGGFCALLTLTVDDLSSLDKDC